MKAFVVADSAPSPRGEGWEPARQRRVRRLTEFQTFFTICRKMK